jgi:hypothetical protein
VTPSGGGYFPQTKTRPRSKTHQKKKILPPVQPKMKKGGIKDLQEYNQEFKQWQLRLIGHIINNKETIKVHVSGLDNKVLLFLLKDGHKFKETTTLAKWQQAAEAAVAKCEEKVGQETTAEKTKLVRPLLQKLKEHMVWNQMKRLTKSERKQIIEETTIKFLDGEELISIIRRLDINTMYITKKKSLEIPLELLTYQRKEEIATLVDSGTTDNFINYQTITKLCLGIKKIPKARQIYNVNGTQNQAGLIEDCVHLYVE